MAVQIELHRHLDASLRTSTLLELAQERGIVPESTSLAAFAAEFILAKPLSSLSEVLSKFRLFQLVQDRPEVLERVAFECVEDCWREGTRKVELRFSPGFVTEVSGLAWADALSAYEDGIYRACAEYPGMQAGLICIATRDYGVDSLDESVEFFAKHADRLIGFDLAGDETAHPNELFADSFRRLARHTRNVTIHSGESTGPETVWSAIDLLGARRIGHGIASHRDPALLTALRERNILLEVCPSSNVITSCVPSFEAHPLPQLVAAGVPVCLNSDDPGIFGLGLADEIRSAKSRLGITDAQLDRMFADAGAHSFLK